MIEYCSAMHWECPVASWNFSTRLVTYGVMLPCIMLTITLAVSFPSLEFFSKLSQGSRTQKYAFIGDDCKVTVSQNDEVIYTEMLSRSPDGTFHFKHPDHSSSSSKPTINFGDWVAPVKGTASKVASSLLVLVGLGGFWAIIHVLMSLSRTVRKTDRAITTSRGDETRDDVSNS